MNRSVSPATSSDRLEWDVQPLSKSEQAGASFGAQRLDLFADGIHEAVITVVNGGSTKEQVEEVVLARQNHLRTGESVSLVERGGDDVIHQQFHTLVSVQAILADLKHRGIEADVKINWGN